MNMTSVPVHIGQYCTSMDHAHMEHFLMYTMAIFIMLMIGMALMFAGRARELEQSLKSVVRQKPYSAVRSIYDQT